MATGLWNERAVKSRSESADEYPTAAEDRRWADRALAFVCAVVASVSFAAFLIPMVLFLVIGD